MTLNSLRPTVAQRAMPACDDSDHCITCSDEGVPMRVVACEAGSGLAQCVDDAGTTTEVMTGLVEPVRAGDMLLVHAGTALTRLRGTDAGGQVA